MHFEAASAPVHAAQGFHVGDAILCGSAQRHISMHALSACPVPVCNSAQGWLLQLAQPSALSCCAEGHAPNIPFVIMQSHNQLQHTVLNPRHVHKDTA